MQEHKDKKNLIEQGFTLIELLVVIAILGILAAVVVFSVNGITDRGKHSACVTEVSTVQTAIEAYFAQNDAYPAGSGFATLSTDIGPGAGVGHKFLDTALTATSPSVVAGFDYNGSAFTGGNCP